MKLSIIIPCFNEENTLKKIVKKVIDVNLDTWEKEIIIINDASKDKSLKIAQNLSKKNPEIISVINSHFNQGKTQTVKKGILASTGDYIIIQDADLEYEPNDFPNLLEKINKKNADVVYGNRFGKNNKIIYIKNYIGNKFLSFISNIFTYPRIRVWIPDMEVCYKLIKGEIARKLAKTIESTSNFGFEPEITAKLAKYKKENNERLNFQIVAINYNPRTIEEGKHMNAFKDGFKALWEIIKFNI